MGTMNEITGRTQLLMIKLMESYLLVEISIVRVVFELQILPIHCLPSAVCPLAPLVLIAPSTPKFDHDQA